MGFEENLVNFDYESLFRLILALGLGALIGFERQLKHHPAGLRTHMMVSMGAALFTVVSLSFDVESARIAAGIVTGIGFLGAGTIIAHKGHIQGITSAATLWVVAAVGLAVGVGQYWVAVVSSIAIFLVLQLGRFEKQSSPVNDETQQAL